MRMPRKGLVSTALFKNWRSNKGDFCLIAVWFCSFSLLTARPVSKQIWLPKPKSWHGMYRLTKCDVFLLAHSTYRGVDKIFNMRLLLSRVAKKTHLKQSTSAGMGNFEFTKCYNKVFVKGNVFFHFTETSCRPEKGRLIVYVACFITQTVYDVLIFNYLECCWVL